MTTSAIATAAEVAARLEAHAAPAELDKMRRRLPPGEPALGVRMKDVFDTAKAAAAMSAAELYLAHHDRITTWDMVDRTRCGGGRRSPRRSGSPATGPTRTWPPASTWRPGLCADPEPSVHKAVGIFLAHAGTRAPERLASFLAEHGETMPATAQRLATRKQGTA